uniref:Family with sequence similarity 163 member B n=1 Tax=Taeniopygia guttata TaxID=59729 RepID=H0Z5E7_TAEGU
MTAGTVVITGGILATVILLCIIAVLCYCRLQYYCCKKDESEEDEEEPDFAVHSHIPPLHCNRNVVLTNGPSLYSSSPFAKKPSQSRSSCHSCAPYEPAPAALIAAAWGEAGGRAGGIHTSRPGMPPPRLTPRLPRRRPAAASRFPAARPGGHRRGEPAPHACVPAAPRSAGLPPGCPRRMLSSPSLGTLRRMLRFPPPGGCSAFPHPRALPGGCAA